MAENNDMDILMITIDGFRFQEELIVAKREIAELYHPADNVKVYRTFVNNPPSDIDITPRAYRNNEDDAVVSRGLSQDEYDTLKEGKKKEFISDRSLSVNNTRQAAIFSGKKTYKSIAKRYDEDYADVFMREERGTYIGGIILKPGQAIITDFNNNGHADLLLNEGVRPEDLEIFEELTTYDYKDE